MVLLRELFQRLECVSDKDATIVRLYHSRLNQNILGGIPYENKTMATDFED